MSYSTNPVRDAADYWDAKWASSDAQARAERAAAESMVEAMLQNRPLTPVWYLTGSGGKRRSTVIHQLVEAIDCTDSLDPEQLLLTLARAARGENVAAEAHNHIEALAQAWARLNVEAGD